jgi:hypothetical protein
MTWLWSSSSLVSISTSVLSCSGVRARNSIPIPVEGSLDATRAVISRERSVMESFSRIGVPIGKRWMSSI